MRICMEYHIIQPSIPFIQHIYIFQGIRLEWMVYICLYWATQRRRWIACAAANIRFLGPWRNRSTHFFFYPQKPGPTLSIFLDLYIKLYWYIYIYICIQYMCVWIKLYRDIYILSLSIYIYTLRSYQTWQWEIPGQKWRFRAGKIIHEIFHVWLSKGIYTYME